MSQSEHRKQRAARDPEEQGSAPATDDQPVFICRACGREWTRTQCNIAPGTLDALICGDLFCGAYVDRVSR